LYFSAQKRLQRIVDADNGAVLRGGLVGLEKESLRVAPDGKIAQTTHPALLGSPLSHPYITTDYSEALLELITPPMRDKAAVLGFLRDAHKFVYDALDEEILWTNSMPCVLEGGAKIPIAQYGKSNAAMMKTIYRRGLGHRYGRTMQVIAGVHYNYSLPPAFWPLFRDLEGSVEPLEDFISARYMGMIRNLQRWGWLVPLLFGVSPAVCKSFLGDLDTDLQEFNASTLYYPHATSLRMGDIGYQNSLEEGRGFKANYDSLDAYVRSLSWAIGTSCPDNEAIGVIKDGQYRQLNANVLQIENEHYSTIRPKQVLEWMEKPSLALRRRGIAYVELRSLDIDAFDPLGVGEQQMHFLEMFLIFCLLNDSPRILPAERNAIDANQIAVAHHGRSPELLLKNGERSVPMSQWAIALMEEMAGLAEALDGGDAQKPYQKAWLAQRAVVLKNALSPSARMLLEMRERKEGFYEFTQRRSLAYRDYFANRELPEQRRAFFQQQASASREATERLEASDTQTFDDFLRDYFAQA
jgi:glutamate--cysteine ligase